MLTAVRSLVRRIPKYTFSSENYNGATLCNPAGDICRTGSNNRCNFDVS